MGERVAPLSIRFSEEEIEWLTARCGKAEKTRNEWVRTAVQQAIRAIGDPGMTPLRSWENDTGTARSAPASPTRSSGSAGTNPGVPAGNVSKRAACDCTGAQLKSTAHNRHLREARYG